MAWSAAPPADLTQASKVNALPVNPKPGSTTASAVSPPPPVLKPAAVRDTPAIAPGRPSSTLPTYDPFESFP